MPPDFEDRRLPTESLSQRIGNEAVSAFTSRHPTSWSVRLLDGGDDFGIDAQAQVADFEGKIVGLFHAQIKGSRTSKLNNAGDKFSVPLRITTLNYYARIESPIMLVFSDLGVEDDPRSCPVYWTWITEDIRDLLAGRPDFSDFEEESITFHVPVANKLERNFDVTEELLRFRRRANALTQLCYSVSQSSGPDVGLPDAIGKLAQALETHGPQLLATLTSPVEGPWIEPPEGSVGASLRQVQIVLERNDDIRAEEQLDDLAERLDLEGEEVEKAEYEYLRGRICSIRKDQEGTIAHYEAAVALNTRSTKYYSVLAETKFIAAFPDDIDAVRVQIAELEHSDDEAIVCIRARLQAAVGDIEPALDSLSGCDSIRCLVAKALILYLDNDWPALIATCESALDRTGIELNDQSLFTLLLARAHYYLGVGNSALEPDGRISPFGNIDMRLDELWKSWGYTESALNLFRTANWPSNVEHIIDVVNVLALSLNKQHDVLNDLDDLSSRRPQFTFAHEALHRLAVLAGDHALALEALDRLPESTEKLHLKILALHSAKQYQSALELAEGHLLEADPEHELRGACLGTAALSAHAILRRDKATQFEAALEAEPNLHGDAAVFKYVHAALENPLSRTDAADELYRSFVADPSSVSIQDNLLPALDARTVDGATKCIEVANAVTARRRLAMREVMHLAQAHTTLHDWTSLQTLAADAADQYGSLASLVSLKALAYEGMGNAAGALKILEEILEQSPNEELAIESYVTICARNGFQKEALQQLENLLQLTTDRSEQVNYIQQIWSLEMAISPDSPRLLDIALRYGALCAPEIEEQEGVFLQMFLMSTLREDTEVSEEHKAEFHTRVEKFFERFPNSTVFKRVELPENLDGEGLKNTLNSALGFTPEAERWFLRVENQLQRGELAAPYAWLPRRFLRNIPDLPYLWAIARTSSKDAHAYHLTISGDPGYQGADLRRGLDFLPLLDLTTLIVLQELDLLDVAFDILRRVALGKRTLADVQRLSHPFFGGYRNMLAISEFLQRNIQRIVQPGNPFRWSDDESKLDKALEEVKQLASTGRYSLYIDDLRARQYIELDQDAVPSITTIDILIEADRRDVLTTSEVSKKLAALIACKVIIPVKGQYFLAAIPSLVDGVDDVEALLRILGDDETFSEMAGGLWDVRKDYGSSINHVAFQMAHIAKSHDAKIELLAAVWETWLASVKFRADLPYTALEHAANCLVLAASLARTDPFAIKRLWDSYVLIVQIVHGETMDEAREAEARELVGQVTAKIAQEKEPEFRDAISTIMASGLRDGTEEFDRFSSAYETERIRLASDGGDE